MDKENDQIRDWPIQEISGFFEKKVENLETPAPPPSVKKPPSKNKNENSEKRKAIASEDSNENPQKMRNHSTTECVDILLTNQGSN